MSIDALIGMAIVLVVCVFILLICREIVCWYWKMSATVKVLKEIRDYLKTIEYYIKIKL